MQWGAENADVQILTGFLLYNHEAFLVEFNLVSVSDRPFTVDLLLTKNNTVKNDLKSILFYAHYLILFF